MRKYILILTPLIAGLILIFSNCTSTLNKLQDIKPFKEFNFKSFDKNHKIASWLYQYDIVAWWTSDSVMKELEKAKVELGPEWFCYEIGDNFYAVYGKYDTATLLYNPVFHYKVSKKGKVNKIDNNIDTNITNPLARSINATYPFIDSVLTNDGVKLNWYTKKEADNKIHVWLLPSMTDKHAIYGCDFEFIYDSTGSNLLEKRSNFIGFKAFKTNKSKKAALNNKMNDVPTVGNIFFYFSFRKYFKKIYIYNKKSMSTMLYNENTKDNAWIHVVN